MTTNGNNICKNNEILNNAEITNINLEKCMYLEHNLFNEISEYKKNVKKFLNFDLKNGDDAIDLYFDLYFMLLHNNNNIIIYIIYKKENI